jgi:hypothetical protein
VPGQTRCGDRCVDIDTDESHCGTCGVECAGDERCIDGQCACGDGVGGSIQSCDGTCVNVMHDSFHCGGCERSCTFGTVCAAGTCDERTFYIGELFPEKCDVIEDTREVVAPRGSIAASSRTLLYQGADWVRYQVPALRVAGSVGGDMPFVFSDYQGDRFYALATGALPARFGQQADQLLEIDGRTGQPVGAPIALSRPVRVPRGRAGIFSGYGRIGLIDRGTLRHIEPETGVVHDMSLVSSLPPAATCGVGLHFGVMEVAEGGIYLSYVSEQSDVLRVRLSDGSTEVITSLGPRVSTCGFALSPVHQQWYFHVSGRTPYSPRATSDDQQFMVACAGTTSFDVLCAPDDVGPARR